MSNILITSAGRRVSLVKAFIKELKLIDEQGQVFVTDALPELSAAAQVAHKAFEICKIDSNRYIDVLYKICIKNKVEVIIPTLDTELLILSENHEKFLEANIKIVLSDKALIKKSGNKLKTHKLFEKIGVGTSKIYSKNKYKLPLFIKPKNGSNSSENYIIKNKNQISKYMLESRSLCFFEYLDHDLYDEYTCDLYYSKASDLKCVIPRKRIEIRAGEVSKGITKKNEVKTFLERNFSSLNGARGCITVQVFMHKVNKEIKGIEINPRFGGGFPLSYLAGGNYPKWIIWEYILNKNLDYYDDWKADLLMLRYDDEILVNDYKD
ncbi:ATP-grasp domain-containing protein [Flavivirga rizhaonensis]|uniref:ATP-grasp domain-containing protein n=1 Tax=Flavivirga rizhaonensis TaxID=2559571 RepID=A0A4V3P4I4_9FLAO|nr:ATP-grasp domain-containing protein [Flavivirga rizhaonensis]TGV01584.1 ATP-grasp domain-containing protein [Flavivirga rizhaonensis]